MVDLGMLASDLMPCAVPTRPVLEYMVERAPDKRIAEIGSGSGYWAALLELLAKELRAMVTRETLASQRDVRLASPEARSSSWGRPGREPTALTWCNGYKNTETKDGAWRRR